MKYSKRAVTCAVAAAAAATTASAWSTSSTFLGRAALVSRPSAGVLATSSSSAPSRDTMRMFFGNLFGGGGAAGQTIDYSVLDSPGPELAKFAVENKVPAVSEKYPNLRLATFAGGCFWGLELAYQRVPGVVYTAVGYTQGMEEYPNYNQVCSGGTGHTEAVVVYYDPSECSYDALLDTFFSRVDPTTVNGQGNDRGKQYRTGVYTHSPEQEAAAKKRFEEVQKKYKKPIASELKSAMPFWPAEKYHQQYLEKGGRMGMPQDASKGATETIRCYG